ncbi:hypothetical protein LPLAFNJD_LOCUS52 [Methylorubrum aminovorans]
MDWRLHWLEAEGDLAAWRDRIGLEIEAARQAVAGILPPFQLDILVERVTGAVIPEVGTTGRAYRPGLCSLTVDPLNPNFAVSLDHGDIRRTIAHEVHHCRRFAGPGYGDTLGEALVSEGLAGHFAGTLFDASPEPWECALDDAALRAHRPSAAELRALNQDHAGWFFGAGGCHPRWLGYTLGYRIVGDWLAANPAPEGETWVNVPADVVLAASPWSAAA